MKDDKTAPETAPNKAARQAPDVPRGWEPGVIETRLAGPKSLKPASYDAKKRTVEAVMATNYRVKRWFGWEELAIRADSVDLTRLEQGQIRLLDSHDQWGTDKVLGNVISARIEGGKLLGTIQFAESDAGREAERAVAAGELTGVSVGYRTNKLILSEMGDGEDLDVYRADKWELLELSLVSVPADPYATMRSVQPAPAPKPPAEPAAPTNDSILARMRMRARQIGLGL